MQPAPLMHPHNFLYDRTTFPTTTNIPLRLNEPTQKKERYQSALVDLTGNMNNQQYAKYCHFSIEELARLLWSTKNPGKLLLYENDVLFIIWYSNDHTTLSWNTRGSNHHDNREHRGGDRNDNPSHYYRDNNNNNNNKKITIITIGARTATTKMIRVEEAVEMILIQESIILVIETILIIIEITTTTAAILKIQCQCLLPHHNQNQNILPRRLQLSLFPRLLSVKKNNNKIRQPLIDNETDVLLLFPEAEEILLATDVR
jgi:hypothetical protein